MRGLPRRFGSAKISGGRVWRHGKGEASSSDASYGLGFLEVDLDAVDFDRDKGGKDRKTRGEDEEGGSKGSKEDASQGGDGGKAKPGRQSEHGMNGHETGLLEGEVQARALWLLYWDCTCGLVLLV